MMKKNGLPAYPSNEERREVIATAAGFAVSPRLQTVVTVSGPGQGDPDRHGTVSITVSWRSGNDEFEDIELVVPAEEWAKALLREVARSLAS